MKIFDNFTGQWVKEIDPETLEVQHTSDPQEAANFDKNDYNEYIFELNFPQARFGRPKDRQPK